MSDKTRSFRGRVGGITYTDPALFETAAKALGFHGYGRRLPRWKVGTPVAITLEDGREIAGQVWSLADVRNYVWVALDDGTFAAVYTPGGWATRTPLARERLGRVA